MVTKSLWIMALLALVLFMAIVLGDTISGNGALIAREQSSIEKARIDANLQMHRLDAYVFQNSERMGFITLWILIGLGAGLFFYVIWNVEKQRNRDFGPLFIEKNTEKKLIVVICQPQELISQLNKSNYQLVERQ